MKDESKVQRLRYISVLVKLRVIISKLCKNTENDEYDRELVRICTQAPSGTVEVETSW